MKFVAFTLLFVAVAFSTADASLVGELHGITDLLPALNSVAKSVEGLASAKVNVAEALDKTKNCGSSGSTQGISDVTSAESGIGKSLAALANDFSSITNSNGQLTGDISIVTNGFRDLGSSVDVVNFALNSLAENIDNESADGLDGLSKVLIGAAQSILKLADAIKNVKGPSSILDALASGLSGFSKSLEDLYGAISKQSKAVSSAQNRCGISSNVPNALNKLNGGVDALHSALGLLASL